MAPCDITKVVIRANQGLTVHFTPATDAAKYELTLYGDGAPIVLQMTATPFIGPPVAEGAYEGIVNAFDSGDAVVGTGAEFAITVAAVSKSAGRILRQQLTDILASAAIDAVYVVRDAHGNYQNMHENNAMISTRRTPIVVGPAVLNSSRTETVVRRVETWEIPIHVIVPGKDFDLCMETAGEIVSQVIRAVESVEYLAIPGIGVADRAWRWQTDTTFDDDTGTVLYSLILTVDVQTDIL